ncbi:hypothetical protein VTN00DRAFT_4024 [Thermoascus crustaceus]|uniref:uncharacterized protein n=1 Tax=Thermoascus crustaceus TaxID=5088 RepID=UPI0037448C2A
MKGFFSFAFCIAAASAQSVIESSSFGHGPRISPSQDGIPGWRIAGEGHTPQILSNKVILTPPYPGNTRGYAWAENPVTQPEWTAEFQFRATGPERASGNLQLWYAKDGQTKIGSSSIYTVGQFDGFALVIDTHGGRGGSVRGFLNDGTMDYKSHGSVDSLAFGHCDYPYRNLGRPSVVRIKHTNSVFQVTVDDKLCFETNKVALPAGNNFGISAATPENPDSFEIFKFVLSPADSGAARPPLIPQQQQPPPQQQQGSQQPIFNQNAGDQGIEDRPASYYTTWEQQFADLHTRLQLINHASSNLIREVTSISSKINKDHQELLQNVATKDMMAILDSRLQRIEQSLQNIKRDIEGKDYQDRFAQLQETLKHSHLSLADNLQGTIHNIITTSSPRMGLFIFLIIAFQLLLAGLYVYYKRRRANMPKKFL